MNRGRALLVAQRKGLPLGAPPDYLNCDPEYLRAWRDIVGAAPDVLRAIDRNFVAALSVSLATWRAGDRSQSTRELYRALGNCFISMRERRRLLFPNRPPRP
jgi:hypothetical protein